MGPLLPLFLATCWLAINSLPKKRGEGVCGHGPGERWGKTPCQPMQRVRSSVAKTPASGPWAASTSASSVNKSTPYGSSTSRHSR